MRFMNRLCKKYLHFVLAVYILGSVSNAFAQNWRKPANFVPDDDMIVVPMIIENNYIDEFHQKNKKRFDGARKKLNYWLSQEQYAQDYGLEGTGIVKLPSEDQKMQFFQRNYMRYLSKDFERTTNEGIQSTLEEWTADDEIDAIKMVEMHEKVIIRARRNRGQADLKKSKAVKVGKDKFRFGFQPRLEIGMVKFTMKSNYFYATAFMGVNGKQEVKLEKKFKKTRTKTFVNYYIDETKVLAALDQPLYGKLSFRYTHSKDFDDPEKFNETTVFEDNIFQLRFNIRY